MLAALEYYLREISKSCFLGDWSVAEKAQQYFSANVGGRREGYDRRGEQPTRFCQNEPNFSAGGMAALPRTAREVEEYQLSA
jgi:hypothetical protein